MFPKTGRKIPHDRECNYATFIAKVLYDELGNSHQAQKTLMRWTGANERTTKNWLAGINGPSGEHLLRLMEHSDSVFDCVLKLAHRKAVCHHRLADACAALRSTADLLAEVIDCKQG